MKIDKEIIRKVLIEKLDYSPVDAELFAKDFPGELDKRLKDYLKKTIPRW